jgi:geranylgeranyl pyrophosphate synthase
LTETAEKLGKPTGSDLKHGKVTYPAAVGLEQARVRARDLAEDAKRALSGYGGDPELLLAMADFIVSRDR